MAKTPYATLKKPDTISCVRNNLRGVPGHAGLRIARDNQILLRTAVQHMTPLEMIRANAELAVQSARERLGVSLSFDRAGAEWLDGHLNRLRGHLSPKAQGGVVNVMGSFLGECIVRSHGGEWIEEGGAWLVQVKRTYTVSVNVFGKVEKQLADLEGESVLSLFDYALEVAQNGGGMTARK